MSHAVARDELVMASLHEAVSTGSGVSCTLWATSLFPDTRQWGQWPPANVPPTLDQNVSPVFVQDVRPRSGGETPLI